MSHEHTAIQRPVLSRAAWVLIANGLAFNLGFYMMLPFLADHLASGIGMAGWAVGLVLGARVFSQQGLFLLGGLLGDRIGYRRAILAGCLVRCAGFALLGLAESFWGLLLAACLSGFAGALFTPCAQAYLADECADAELRRRAFAWHNLASQAGMLLGPLLGLVLVRIDYALSGLLSASLFLVMTGVQWHYLPGRPNPVGARATSVLQQCLGMLKQRLFLRFVLLAAAFQMLFHPLYLAIPAYARGHGGGQVWVGQIFMVCALVGVTLQLPISALRRRWLTDGQGMALGMALMAGSYSLLAEPLSSLLGAQWAVLSMAALLSLGSLLVLPLLSAHLPFYARPGQLAAYYGFYSGVGGIAALLGNLLTGWMLGDTPTPPPQPLWWLLTTLGLVAALGLLLHMRHLDSLDTTGMNEQ